MKKIFIVEDDLDYLEFLTKSLEKKYEVYSYSSAEQCLLSCDVIKPEILILDNFLPGMNGLELFEKIKKEFAFSGRIVILSSMEDPGELLNFVKKGVRDYLVKGDNVIEALIALIEDDEDKYLELITK